MVKVLLVHRARPRQSGAMPALISVGPPDRVGALIFCPATDNNHGKETGTFSVSLDCMF